LEKKIVIVKGIGKGSTALSAFDDALCNAGIGNLNLIELSSVIPKNAILKIQEKYDLPHEIGQIQPVVLSHNESDEKGIEISAGLGWSIAEEGGVFIEISGCFGGETCLDKINSSLNDMIKRRNWNWKEKNKNHICKTQVGDTFTSVVVCAIYTYAAL